MNVNKAPEKFFLLRSDVTWQMENDADSLIAHGKWRMPGLACPDCGGRDRPTLHPGYCYPDVNCLESKALQNALREDAAPLDPEAWHSLEKKITKLLNRDITITPGTEFGPCEETITGQPADCYPSVHFFVTEDAWKKIREIPGMNFLVAVPSNVRAKKRPSLKYMEFQIEASVRLGTKLDTKRILKAYKRLDVEPVGKWKLECNTCGRKNGDLPNRAVLVRSSVPVDVPLFRVADHPSSIICTEAFMNAALRFGLTNICFVPTRVMDAPTEIGD